MMSACCSDNTHINIAAPHPAMGYGTAMFFSVLPQKSEFIYHWAHLFF